MILMLKKLVIIGSLLAIGPMLAGCFDQTSRLREVIAAQENAKEIADRRDIPESRLKQLTTDDLCARMVSGRHSWAYQLKIADELQDREQLSSCSFGAKITSGSQSSTSNAKITTQQKERERRTKLERQRQAEEARQAEAEWKRRAEAKRQAEKRRHAEAKRKAEERRKAEQRQKAEAKREAEERRQAEAKRKANAAKKSKLHRVGSGSGFSISRDGLVVTNHHVIDGCEAVDIPYKGEMHRAVVLSVDERNDLALLKSKLRPAHVFALNPEGTDILRDIYVAGYPFGRIVSNSVKVTKGIVSSLVGLKNNSSQIQIDAPIQGGNSGGPILDDKGRVVGVTVSKLDVFKMIKERNQIPEGIAFGVKSQTLIQMLKSSGVQTYKKGGLKTTDDIAKAIRGGTFYISCLMTAERYKRLTGKKVMFEGVDLE